MQTPKKSLNKSGASEVPKRASPKTPRSARQTNSSIIASESDSATSPCPGSKTPVKRSPKAVERMSPKSPISEKKKPSRVKELESQLAQFKEDLKKTKDQLASSESCKNQAEQEIEEVNKQLAAVNAKFKETQHLLKELSQSEDDRVLELKKINQERDRAWESELEVVKKQHTVDSAALLSAMNEIQDLKQQLEITTSSEAAKARMAEAATCEIQILKQNFAETHNVLKSFKTQLEESEKSETECHQLVIETKVQLDIANATIETLKFDGLKTVELLNAVSNELVESKAQIRSLENSMRNLQIDDQSRTDSLSFPDGENDELALKTELNSRRLEIEQLRFALEIAEMKYQEEQIKCLMHVHSSYEAMEHTKIESCFKEAELELALNEAKVEVAALKVNLIEKETEMQSREKLEEQMNNEVERSHDETELKSNLQKSMKDIAELKAKLIDKETKLQNILEENHFLKLEIEKKESERIRTGNIAQLEAENARSAEQDYSRKTEILSKECERLSERASVMTEQLEAAEAENSKIEAELRRMRVQTDQWRKAAEAAAAILSSGKNGRLMERSGSLDSDYNSIRGKLLNSPFSDDLGEESPKKKNNMLKKIGVLWKKGQK